MLCRLSLGLLCLFLIATSASSQWRSPFSRARTPSVAVAVSPAGFRVAVARSSGSRAKRYGRVELGDTKTGELQRTITGFDVLWDLKTGAVKDDLRKHNDVINALAFSTDGTTLASGDDRTVILWDVATGKITRTLKGHDTTVTSLAFSSDGVKLASGSGNAAVVLWNV